MIVLDTNAIIRFITKDDIKKAEKVKTLIESDNELIIPDVVFDELEYVLHGSIYNVPRSDILKIYKFLISQNNINVSSEILYAVDIYENSSVEMSDCLVAAKSILLKAKLASFDKKLLLTKDVKSYW